MHIQNKHSGPQSPVGKEIKNNGHLITPISGSINLAMIGWTWGSVWGAHIEAQYNELPAMYHPGTLVFKIAAAALGGVIGFLSGVIDEALIAAEITSSYYLTSVIINTNLFKGFSPIIGAPQAYIGGASLGLLTAYGSLFPVIKYIGAPAVTTLVCSSKFSGHIPSCYAIGAVAGFIDFGLNWTNITDSYPLTTTIPEILVIDEMLRLPVHLTKKASSYFEYSRLMFNWGESLSIWSFPHLSLLISTTLSTNRAYARICSDKTTNNNEWKPITLANDLSNFYEDLFSDTNITIPIKRYAVGLTTMFIVCAKFEMQVASLLQNYITIREQLNVHINHEPPWGPAFGALVSINIVRVLGRTANGIKTFVSQNLDIEVAYIPNQLEDAQSKR